MSKSAASTAPKCHVPASKDANARFAFMICCAAMAGLLWTLLQSVLPLTDGALLATMHALLSFMLDNGMTRFGPAGVIAAHGIERANIVALLAILIIPAHFALGLALGRTGLIQEKTA